MRWLLHILTCFISFTSTRSSAEILTSIRKLPQGAAPQHLFEDLDFSKRSHVVYWVYTTLLNKSESLYSTQHIVIILRNYIIMFASIKYIKICGVLFLSTNKTSCVFVRLRLIKIE